MEKLEKKLAMAQAGRAFWMGLEEEVGSKLILLTWAENKTLNQLARTHLPTLMAQRGSTGAVVLSSMEDGEDWENLGESVTFRHISTEDRAHLLAYYGLYQFTPNLYIISLARPFGSKLSHLLDHGDGEEEILKHCIYQIKSHCDTRR